MRSDLLRIIDEFSALRVLVIGDAILDRYLEGSSLRFAERHPCRTSPSPIAKTARGRGQRRGQCSDAWGTGGLSHRARRRRRGALPD